jgi:hypothetical protein
MAYVYLQLGPYSYLRAYFPYDNINLTPNIIFLLGFKATFQSTHLTLKGLYCIEITKTPLALCTTYNKHAYFILEFSVYIPYYLDVTFSQQTNPIHSIGPKTHVLGRFRPFCYYTKFIAKQAELVQLKQKFTKRSCARIFRMERT